MSDGDEIFTNTTILALLLVFFTGLFIGLSFNSASRCTLDSDALLAILDAKDLPLGADRSMTIDESISLYKSYLPHSNNVLQGLIVGVMNCE